MSAFFPFRRLNTSWYEYIKTVTNFHVYNPHNPAFKRLLNDLQNGRISEASMELTLINWLGFYILFFIGEMSQGTQIKVLLDLPNGFQGLLKPYRFLL